MTKDNQSSWPFHENSAKKNRSESLQSGTTAKKNRGNNNNNKKTNKQKLPGNQKLSRIGATTAHSTILFDGKIWPTT
jgi:hypothetical protein